MKRVDRTTIQETHDPVETSFQHQEKRRICARLILGIILLLAACNRINETTDSNPADTVTEGVTKTVMEAVTETPPQPVTTAIPTPTATPVETATLLPTPEPISIDTTVDPALVSALDTYLQQLSDAQRFSGSVLIALDGTVILDQGYGLADRTGAIPNTPQTRFRIGSLTKQFTAMAILILQAQGALNVQDPICQYLPDCPQAWQKITIHNLLVHTSGIPDFIHFPDFAASKPHPTTPTETIARFRNAPLDFLPGSRWSYTNSGYIVLGYLIEEVAGVSYGDFLQENIFASLGMHDSGYLLDNDHGEMAIGYRDGSDRPADFIDMTIPFAAGALYSTVEDLLRWNQALDAHALIPPEQQEQMFTPHIRLDDRSDAAYGFGWIIDRKQDRAIIHHTGTIDGFSATIGRYPDDNGLIIVLGNQQGVNPNEIRQQLAQILRQAQ